MSFAANTAIIVLEILGISKGWKGRSWKYFAFYTILSNMMALAASIVYLLAGGQGAVPCLRYLATCMLTMTFFVTACILVPGGGGFKQLMLTGNGLYHHLIVPVLSVISYAFWEPHADMWLLPALTTLAYGAIMLLLNGLGKVDGPYPFFRVKNQSIAATILWMLLLFGMISGCSFLIAKIA
ncbi:MAG: hypothetical protein IKE31_00185 [Eubacterium sp.]|nr:hypothetical protein [Eubacterium sp.]